MFNIFGKKLTVEEQQRETERSLRKVGRDIERDRRGLEREEKKLELEIKKLAREGNNEGCKVLAKQLVQLRKQKTRTYSAGSKSLCQYVIKTEEVNFWKLDSIVKELQGCFTLNLADETSDRIDSEVNMEAAACLKSDRTKQVQSVGVSNKVLGANMKLANAMNATSKTMADMNKIMKPEQVAADMRAFGQASMKLDMTDEMINDTLDDMLTESGDEEEGDKVVQQVLDEIGIEISGKMAAAPAAHRGKLGESSKSQLPTDEEIEAQLAKLRS